jgi:hypothetical protein
MKIFHMLTLSQVSLDRPQITCSASMVSKARLALDSGP